MTPDTFDRKLSNRIADFSGHLMSNSKWYKLFRCLSGEGLHVLKIEIISVWSEENSKANELQSSHLINFEDTFSNTGIKDVLTGGPLSFKEILRVIIHAKPIIEVEEAINNLGTFETEKINDTLVVLGYRN